MLTRSRLGAIACAVLVAAIAASAQAAIVWDLNPSPRKDGAAGSAVLTYTSSGMSITAYGFDNHSGVGTAHELFYKSQTPKDGAVEFGLGLTNTLSNEIQPGLHFIQFDFTAAQAAGLFNGQISVGSVQAGELFAFYGSNTLGNLGVQVGGPFDSTMDNQFVSIPNFGQFSYYSVVALADDVLPVAVRGDVRPVPEMNALVPIAALLVVLVAVKSRRRRQGATA